MAKKNKKNITETENTVSYSTEVQQGLQKMLEAIAGDCSENSAANTSISNSLTSQSISANSITGISGNSYTINGYDTYPYNPLSNYNSYSSIQSQPRLHLDANYVTIEYNGQEYPLGEILARLEYLEQFVRADPVTFLSDILELKEKVNKLEEEVALRKLDEVINS